MPLALRGRLRASLHNAMIRVLTIVACPTQPDPTGPAFIFNAYGKAQKGSSSGLRAHLSQPQ